MSPANGAWVPSIHEMRSNANKHMTTMVVSAVLNALILGGIPLLVFYIWQKRRGRSNAAVLDRAGLRRGDWQTIRWCAIVACAGVLAIAVVPPPIAAFNRASSPQRAFIGIGWLWPAVPMAIIYGVAKTGLPEELLFRGLIAGSFDRVMPRHVANLAQATVFLIPHLVAAAVAPELAMIVPLVFVGAVFVGWARARSGSIVGPVIIHAALNTAVCLSVAWRTRA